MQFHDFPTDILALLLNGQNSWSAIELYKCGNRSLNNKIVKSVTHIDLKDTEPLSTSRWPRCLKEFKLESLSIFRNGGTLGTTEMVRGELKKLSSTLKDIEIHAVNIGMCFFDETKDGHPNTSGGSMHFGDERDDPGDDSSDGGEADGEGDGAGVNKDDGNEEAAENESDADDEPRPTKRSKTSECEAHEDVLHTSMWNLEFTWPHLERLELSDAQNFLMGTPGCFGSSVFTLLPRSLAWFGFHYAFTYESLVDLSALPPRLKTLRLSYGSINKSGLRTLPKTLTDVGYSLEDDNALPLLLKKPSLLPNLKEFPYDSETDEMGAWIGTYILEDNHPWPKNLSNVLLWEVDESFNFEDFPPSLTKLQLQGSDLILTAEHVLALPRNLTTLDVGQITWNDFDVNSWPSTLTQLSFTDGSEFGAYCFQYLPRSLKELKTSYSGADDEEEPELSRICNDINELRTIGKDSLLLDDANWQVEKQRLLAAGSQAYVDEIEAGGLYGLPLSLTRMDIESILYPLTQRLLMPPHIKEVCFPRTDFKVDDPTLFDAFKYIAPVSLTIATLLAPTSSTSTQDSDLSSHVHSALFASNLSSLDVTLASRSEATPIEHTFRYLPRGLRHLVIHRYVYQPEQAHSEEIDDLPQNLESLTLDCTFGLDSWVKRLPRTLKSLAVHPEPLRGNDIVNLPPHLESLEANFHGMALTHVYDLPRTLRSVTVRSSTAPAGAPSASDSTLSESGWKTLLATYRPLWRVWNTVETELAHEIELGETGEPKTDDIDFRTVRRFQPHASI